MTTLHTDTHPTNVTATATGKTLCDVRLSAVEKKFAGLNGLRSERVNCVT